MKYLVMIPRLFIPLIICFVSYHPLYADFGNFYCLKITVKLKDGSAQHGYVGTYDVGIQKDEKGFLYYNSYNQAVMRLRSAVKADNAVDIIETDYHFHTFVFQQLLFDSIRLNSDVVFLYPPENKDTGEPSVPVFLGDELTISRSEVLDIVVHRVHICYAVTRVETKCQQNDITWLKDKIVATDDIGGVELCSYQAYYFASNKNEVAKIVYELKQLFEAQQDLVTNAILVTESYPALQVKIDKKIEELRKYKVIVIGSCSC